MTIFNSIRRNTNGAAQQYANLNATFRSSGNFNDLTVADYKIATLHHWLRGYNDQAVVSRALSLERAGSPDGTLNGQKTWFDYAGKVNLGNGNWGTQGRTPNRSLTPASCPTAPASSPTPNATAGNCPPAS